jgi:hypothetical protein
MIKVTDIKPQDNYNVFVQFDNGQSGVIDFKHILENDHRDIIRSLLDKNMFQTMKIDMNTICWDNNADFAPDFLLENCAPQR